MERISGVRAERVLGRVALEVFPFLVESGEDQIFRRVLAGEPVQTRERPYRVPESGREGWFAGSYFPVRDATGSIVGGMAVIRDLSEAEQQAVQESDRRKDQLLALLGHELRNPLGAIRTARQVIDHPDTTAEEVTRQRAIIDRQLRHLARVVDDLLDVGRLLSGRIALEKQTVDLNEIAQQCLLAVRRGPGPAQEGLSLTVEPAPLLVSGDPVRLEQIASNLLDNALKYTPAGGRIEVSVAREPGVAVLRVADTGVGIAPEMLPHVFDPLVQADASLARSRGGLGLGLTLVRQLVDLHGGRVSARSAGVGRGSEFVVTLPALASAPAARRAPAAPAAPASPRRVLLIEDNPDARDALCTLLEMWGHEVEVAEDGPGGFDLALATRPDVVVVDIGLPGLDGYHVAQGLRAALRESGVFLVALTGYGQPEERRRALEAGFDVHLVKPVDPGELSEILARAPVRRAG